MFFDLGGTLFEYPKQRKSFGKFIEQVGAVAGDTTIPNEEIGQAFGRAHQQVSKEFAQLDYYLHADMFRATYEYAFENLALQADETLYQEYSAHQHESIVTGMALKNDCIETLAALKEKGLYCSIVSNIDEDMLQPLVTREGLENYLDHWTSSEAAQSCKPHAKFFEVSLDKSGLAAEQVLFVGDSPEHDINGAKPLGFQTVLVQNGNAPPLQSGAAVVEPHHVVTELKELLALV